VGGAWSLVEPVSFLCHLQAPPFHEMIRISPCLRQPHL
jgi:hypothetical protein